ncbi:MAG: NYN domain-containing protein [Oscillospiraceae bacterium]|nr:NYN domain-containing protein [Oscillospiraceae bacterium]
MKTAVFYDLENVGLSRKPGEFEQAIAGLTERIKASELVGDIVLQKAYIRKTHASVEQLVPILKKHKIEAVMVEWMSDSVRKKTNLVDFKMGIDAIATISLKRSIQTVAIASGDNDFGFLCQQIKEMGKKLLVISRFNTTGDIMLKLCDDWIDLNKQALTPKFICKAIETRVPVGNKSGDFYIDFKALINALEADVLIRRYMKTFGLPLSTFTGAMQTRGIIVPRIGTLGFASLTDFMEVLLYESNFECRSGYVKYKEKKNTLSQQHLIKNIVRLPPGYTREKLLKYYDLIDGIENVDEMQTYISFMRRNGMLKGSALCNRRTFRATIRSNLKKVMEKAGLAVDEDALAEFNETL